MIRVNRLPALEELDPGDELSEADRPAEAEAFWRRRRGGWPSGSANVPPRRPVPPPRCLSATAQLAQDRAWLGAAEKAINAGMPAARDDGGRNAVHRDVHKMGGLMAEW